MKTTREEMIEAAIGLNESYRIGEDVETLEVGFLYGTAELITTLTLGEDESFSDVRKEIAKQIDKGAAESTYPLLPENFALGSA